MTDCQQNEIRDRLPEYVHGTLGASERARVEAHLAGCAECRGEVALLRSMSAAMARSAPAVDVQRIVTAAKAARAVPTRPELAQMRRPVPQYVWRVAAAVLFMVVGATGYYFGRANTGTSPVQVATNPTQTLSRPMPQAPAPVPAVAPAPAPAHVQPAAVGLSFGGDELSPAQARALISDLEKSAPAIDPEPAAIIDIEGTS